MLFAYGTLQFPPVLQALLGRVPPMEEATLPGWRAAALPGRIYPGLVPGDSTRGRLIAELTAGEWSVLDAFEGSDYDRGQVVLDDGRTVWTYVWRHVADVAAPDWDPARFEREALEAYSARCRRWRSAST